MDHLPENDPKLKELLPKLHEIVKKDKDPILYSRYMYWDAVIHHSKNNVLSTPGFLDKAISMIDTTKYMYDYARIRFLMINPIQSSESYINLYNTYIKLRSIFHEAGDIVNEANVNRRLGILMSELEEYGSALEYMQKADILYRKAKRKSLISSNNLNMSVVYFNLNKKEKSMQILNDLLHQNSSQSDTTLLITIYTNLHNFENNAKKKDEYAMTAFLLAKAYKKDQYLEDLTQYNLAERYLINNKKDSAFLFFQSVYNSALKNHTTRILIPSILGLARTEADKGMYKEAYHNLEEYILMKDSIKGIDKVAEINKMHFGFEIKEYQNQLVTEQQKAELYRIRTLVTILISVGIVSLSVFIFIYFWQKKRLAETQLKNEELHTQNLQQEVDSQNRELSTTTLILNEKNIILKNIQSQLEHYKNAGEVSYSCEQKLNKLITDNLQSENEWETFKLHFEKVHPDFFKKLKDLHTSITDNDLKLCAYIRIGLNAKQIGQMISVLPSTIKTNRYLLKKKLNLDADMSLDDYIRMF